jgi:hypothetical protein
MVTMMRGGVVVGERLVRRVKRMRRRVFLGGRSGVARYGDVVPVTERRRGVGRRGGRRLLRKSSEEIVTRRSRARGARAGGGSGCGCADRIRRKGRGLRRWKMSES